MPLSISAKPHIGCKYALHQRQDARLLTVSVSFITQKMGSVSNGRGMILVLVTLQ